MKIILLLNHHKVSPQGVFLINGLFKVFSSIKILKCRKIHNSKRDKIKFNLKNIIIGMDLFLVNLECRIVYKNVSRIVASELNPLIPLEYVDSEDINSDIFIKKLEEEQPDIVVHISGDILKTRILQVPLKGTLNIHHGILPDIRGRDAYYWAIKEGKDNWLGVTVHYIDEGIDTGSIINKERLTDIKNISSMPKLILKLEEIALNLLIKSIKEIIEDSQKDVMNPSNEGVYRSSAPFYVRMIAHLKIMGLL